MYVGLRCKSPPDERLKRSVELDVENVVLFTLEPCHYARCVSSESHIVNNNTHDEKRIGALVEVESMMH